MDELMNMDLYELLQIDPTANHKEIKTAYRKKALSCHPDKNPDNPKAAELFQELSKALEILTDGAARFAYDRLLKARKDTVKRNLLLDSKRRKLKDDLEARERAARDLVETRVDAAKSLAAEIERLRKEGSKQLEEERILMKKHLEEELKKQLSEEVQRPRLKVAWKAAKKDPNNGGYSYDDIMDTFSKYGEITCLVLGKKGGTALIEFSSLLSAQSAFECEKGNADNLFNITWIQGQPITVVEPEIFKPTDKQTVFEPETLVTEKDYESLVLTKLRQAQERKRLIEEMEKEQV